jgi:hypothetical protein
MPLTLYETRRLLRVNCIDLATANQAEAEGRLADLFVPVNLSASAVAERCVQGEFQAVLSGAGHADERAVALPHCSLEDLHSGPPEFFREVFEGAYHSRTRFIINLRCIQVTMYIPRTLPTTSTATLLDSTSGTSRQA